MILKDYIDGINLKIDAIIRYLDIAEIYTTKQNLMSLKRELNLIFDLLNLTIKELKQKNIL